MGGFLGGNVLNEAERGGVKTISKSSSDDWGEPRPGDFWGVGFDILLVCESEH